ncbi:MAG: sigma factor-like helix-turn-helix DNA-binding protein [Patescibacteria group bacterium]|jgi:hypothetical protein|nr:sigma factor-like helix-turn-helix DNA-binding protein [Patescibacteria group bacterium]HPL01820.1 sigma factor-like helix-turn-helix DNA-binding protein [bacterium]
MAEKRKTEKNSLIDIIDGLVLKLNEKEKRSITGRFGLTGRKETLSLIGKDLGLSRERIRQIEKNSLRKLRLDFNKNYKNKIDEIINLFEKNGGIVVDDNIGEDFIKLAGNYKFAKNYLRLAFSIISEIESIDESSDLLSGWRIDKVLKEKIISINKKVIEYLKDIDLPKDFSALRAEVVGIEKEPKELVKSAIMLSAKIVEAKNGMIGLKSWPSVNPRNVRDKIYYVLKTGGKPMHFKDITEEIAKLKFDNKKVVQATVHNELIADKRFVLIGRGIYALREWGYSDGTVYDVIKNILSNSKRPVSLGEIISLVNKSRKVKKNTILINLQTNKIFKKVEGGYVVEKL